MSTEIMSGPVSANANDTPKRVVFTVEDECLRTVRIKDGEREIKVYHIYPKLGNWLAGAIPDEVNPRSHEAKALESGVAKGIESTLRDEPSDFFLANRGSTILAESVAYNKARCEVEIVINDPEMQGLADGATTDAVIAKVKKDLCKDKGEHLALEDLNRGRVHLEVIVGLNDRDRIGRMVLGRNTSRQVKSWSIADFKGEYDWVKDILDVKGSPFKDVVGYEENAGKPVTILDVLSILTLFHPEWDDRSSRAVKAPTVAYSSKGRMDKRFSDKRLLEGYKGLKTIVKDILQLHDYVYSILPEAYKEAKDGKAKLGRRSGFENDPHTLPLTSKQADYNVPSGVLFPLLASLRALVSYETTSSGTIAKWIVDPHKFFDKHRAELVGIVFDQLDMLGGNPNTVGKKRPVYTTLHDRARLLLSDDIKTSMV